MAQVRIYLWATSQKKLLEGERNECIDYYLSEIPDRYLAAVRAGFPALPKTLVNIHVEMAARCFDKLEIRLRYKCSYSQTEIEGNLVHAEAITLATACNQLNLDYEECEGILSDTAYDLAASHYNEKLTPRENFSKISGGSDLSGKSRMYRSWVSNAFNFIAQDE